MNKCEGERKEKKRECGRSGDQISDADPLADKRREGGICIDCGKSRLFGNVIVVLPIKYMIKTYCFVCIIISRHMLLPCKGLFA